MQVQSGRYLFFSRNAVNLRLFVETHFIVSLFFLVYSLNMPGYRVSNGKPNCTFLEPCISKVRPEIREQNCPVLNYVEFLQSFLEQLLTESKCCSKSKKGHWLRFRFRPKLDTMWFCQKTAPLCIGYPESNTFCLN